MRLVFWVLVTAACGCGGVYVAERAPARAHAEAGVAIWVVGDTQFNNVTGDRDTSARDDAVENVAIRPPSLDLWSHSILSATLSHAATQSNEPIFFLGDGANTSCYAEYVHFLRAMDARVWFGAIGNHDGFYMGNLGGRAEADWVAACRRGLDPNEAWVRSGEENALQLRLVAWTKQLGIPVGTMPKALAVLLYLDDLHRRGVVDIDPLDMAHWKPTTTPDGRSLRRFRFYGTYTTGAERREVSLGAYIGASGTPADKYLAFVVQDVEVSGRNHVLIADTSDFSETPPDGYALAGFKGKVTARHDLPGQLGRIEQTQYDYLASYANAVPDGKHFLVIGHHDWYGLSVHGATLLKAATFAKRGFVTYISGHTHQPTATGGGYNAGHQWEINIASLTDWPMEYARITYWPRNDTIETSDIRVEVLTPTRDFQEADCFLAKAAWRDEWSRADELHYQGKDYARRALVVHRAVLQHVLGASSVPGAQAMQEELTAALCMEQKGRRLVEDEQPGLCDATVRGREMETCARNDVNCIWKQTLRRAITFDQEALARVPTVVAQEQACAVWAAHIEQKYWSAPWWTWFWRRLFPSYQDKEVIPGGRRLEPGTTEFAVSHADFPEIVGGPGLLNAP